MSLKANRKLVGAFVVGAIALAVMAVLLLGGGRFLQQKRLFVMYFDGSVQGLSVGAPVLLKGVKVGAVTDIKLLLDLESREFHTQVYAEAYDRIFAVRPGGAIVNARDAFQRNAEAEKQQILKDLVEKDGLRAQLSQQSFVTGQLLVSLDFHPDKPLKYVHYNPEGYQQLPTIASSMEEISRTIRDIPFDEMAKNIQGIVNGVDKLVNSKELKGTLGNLDGAMVEIREFARKVNEHSEPVVTRLETAIDELKKLLKNIDARVGPLARRVDDTLQDTRGLVADVRKQVDPVAGDLRKTLATAETSLRQAEALLSALNAGASEDSATAYEITSALESFSAAMRSVRDLAAYLQRHPEALLSGKE